ncbi:unnamed protein product, partial [Meganyctiphanes norvegica]
SNLGTLANTPLFECMVACKSRRGCTGFDFKNSTSSPTCILRACSIPAHLWVGRGIGLVLDFDPDYEGYELVKDQNCYDRLQECAQYAVDGDCEENQFFMQKHCKGTCQLFSHQGGTGVRNSCASDQHSCRNGECIPKSSVEDFVLDCIDGSDEARFPLGGALAWINKVPSKVIIKFFCLIDQKFKCW